MTFVRTWYLPILAGLLTACGPAPITNTEPEADSKMIDQRSYQLGGINTFAEIVDLGIKKMALSPPLSPKAMDDIMNDVERIAADHHVELYRETDFLVTDLYPASVTDGKQVLIIYQGSTLDEYLGLKARKKELIEAGKYTDTWRRDIAFGMGRLLSYPDSKIEQLISGD